MGLRIDRGGGGRRDVIRSGQPAPAPTAPVAPAQRAQVPPVRPEGAIALQAALGALQGVSGLLEGVQQSDQRRQAEDQARSGAELGQLAALEGAAPEFRSPTTTLNRVFNEAQRSAFLATIPSIIDTDVADAEFDNPFDAEGFQLQLDQVAQERIGALGPDLETEVRVRYAAEGARSLISISRRTAARGIEESKAAMEFADANATQKAQDAARFGDEAGQGERIAESDAIIQAMVDAEVIGETEATAKRQARDEGIQDQTLLQQFSERLIGDVGEAVDFIDDVASSDMPVDRRKAIVNEMHALVRQQTQRNDFGIRQESAVTLQQQKTTEASFIARTLDGDAPDSQELADAVQFQFVRPSVLESIRAIQRAGGGSGVSDPTVLRETTLAVFQGRMGLEGIAEQAEQLSNSDLRVLMNKALSLGDLAEPTETDEFQRAQSQIRVFFRLPAGETLFAADLDDNDTLRELRVRGEDGLVELLRFVELEPDGNPIIKAREIIARQREVDSLDAQALIGRISTIPNIQTEQVTSKMLQDAMSRTLEDFQAGQISQFVYEEERSDLTALQMLLRNLDIEAATAQQLQELARAQR